MLVLNNQEIAQLLDMESCLQTLNDAARAIAAGDAIARPATSVVMPRLGPEGLRGLYKLENRDGIARPVKMAALRLMSDNFVFEQLPDGKLRREKLASAQGKRYVGLVLLFDTETAELVALLPDAEIQRRRVAGTGALVSKYVARTNAHTLGVLGSGWIAEMVVLSNCLVHDIKKTVVFSPNRERREAFCTKMSQQVPSSVEPVETPEEAVRSSDLVVTVTSAMEPVLKGSWLKPGTHVTLSQPYELDEEGWKLCDLIVEGARPEDGNPSHWRRQIHNNRHVMGGRDNVKGTWLAFTGDRFPQTKARHVALPDLVLGEGSGRQREDEISCFYISNPSGVQVAFLGAQILERAKSAGLGRELPPEWFSEAEKD